MKEYEKMYVPNDIKDMCPAISGVYQQAFSGDPWYEVSKCADSEAPKRCVGGFSPLEIGSFCDVCKNETQETAYGIEELSQKFNYLASTRPTRWYLEKTGEEISLAAIAWKTTRFTLFNEKYSDVTDMQDWIYGESSLDKEFVWLDEVFANRAKRPEGNLWNFRSMCDSFTDQLNCKVLAFRTINPRMISAVKSKYSDLNESTVYRANIDVPDRRDFVILRQVKQKPDIGGFFR